MINLYCDNCGSEIKAGNKFCESCGSEAPEVTGKSKSLNFKPVLIGLVALLVIGGAFTYFGGFFKPNGETPKVVCNPPYIIVDTDCCLDENSNSICDKDEEKKQTELTPQPQKVAYCGDGKCDSDEDFNLCSYDCRRPIKTLFDAFASMHRDWNPENFTLIYGEGPEEPSALDLAKFLGIPSKKTSEYVNDNPNRNLVLFGGGCSNSITQKLLPELSCEKLVNECSSSETGEPINGGYVLMVTTGNRRLINLQGCLFEDTKKIVDAIKIYQETYLFTSTVYSYSIDVAVVGERVVVQ